MNRINFAQIFADNMSNITKLKKADKYEIIRTQSKIEAIETTDLNTIKGVGQTTIKALLEN
jgi:DNA integrity scanning protein DisA with diadenylate cyclase activity